MMIAKIFMHDIFISIYLLAKVICQEKNGLFVNPLAAANSSVNQKGLFIHM